MRSSFPSKIANMGLCVAFVAFLWLPLGARWIAPAGDTPRGENRRAASLPELHFSVDYLKEFPRRFEAYFQDRLPFREQIIGIHHQFKIDALGASPSPNVVIGKKGYLFFTDFPPGEDQKALRPFSAEELNQWRNLLQARHDGLAQHGIQYLLVVAPDKQTIYPDCLPDLVSSRAPKRSRLDQLLEHLRAESTVNALDLRPVLREAREGEEVYYRTDTHWNAAGGYLAYREIVRALRKWLPHLEPLTRDQLEYVHENGTGDLARMIGASDAGAERCPDHFLPKQPRARFLANQPSPFAKISDLTHVPPSMSESDESNPARLVVLNDSFGAQLRNLLAEHFRRVDFLPTYDMPRNLILQERPRVVVQVMVERRLLQPPPADKPPQ